MIEENRYKNLNADNLTLLAKKAINEDNALIPKPFNPKTYLEGNINPFTCKHEIFLKKDSLQVCAICGYSSVYNGEIPNSIEFSYNPETELLIKSLLNLISHRYLDKEQIDLVNIFKQLKPNINQILITLEKTKEHKLPAESNDSQSIKKL